MAHLLAVIAELRAELQGTAGFEGVDEVVTRGEDEVGKVVANVPPIAPGELWDAAVELWEVHLVLHNGVLQGTVGSFCAAVFAALMVYGISPYHAINARVHVAREWLDAHRPEKALEQVEGALSYGASGETAADCMLLGLQARVMLGDGALEYAEEAGQQLWEVLEAVDLAYDAAEGALNDGDVATALRWARLPMRYHTVLAKESLARLLVVEAVGEMREGAFATALASLERAAEMRGEWAVGVVLRMECMLAMGDTLPEQLVWSAVRHPGLTTDLAVRVCRMCSPEVVGDVQAMLLELWNRDSSPALRAEAAVCLAMHSQPTVLREVLNDLQPPTPEAASRVVHAVLRRLSSLPCDLAPDILSLTRSFAPHDHLPMVSEALGELLLTNSNFEAAAVEGEGTWVAGAALLHLGRNAESAITRKCAARLAEYVAQRPELLQGALESSRGADPLAALELLAGLPLPSVAVVLVAVGVLTNTKHPVHPEGLHTHPAWWVRRGCEDAALYVSDDRVDEAALLLAALAPLVDPDSTPHHLTLDRCPVRSAGVLILSALLALRAVDQGESPRRFPRSADLVAKGMRALDMLPTHTVHTESINIDRLPPLSVTSRLRAVGASLRIQWGLVIPSPSAYSLLDYNEAVQALAALPGTTVSLVELIALRTGPGTPLHRPAAYRKAIRHAVNVATEGDVVEALPRLLRKALADASLDIDRADYLMRVVHAVQRLGEQYPTFEREWAAATAWNHGIRTASPQFCDLARSIGLP